ncbi:co-chaperone GroES [Neolewinella lacunae]|uniref:Co-chaperonin GroES n=1 Tax=Neolewinella lacunae TaxID=1517758 RepID=A0A923PNE5_9BACT|nr:co-chaperone GroES [Neolewinella lacunae]MBC6994504.1 co-chaperone GroES [Neolewinella lacunae]MDN3634197.1 co-chaperone GroES [Neolewinella lacunae]
MKPINDRVVVKPAPAEEKTSGGIIIPDTVKEKPQRGEVIAVGPGKDGNLMTVAKGDIVLYGKYAGQEVTLNGQDYLIMREDDILVIVD